MATFEAKLERILVRRIDDCLALKSVERLSGGAAQETYRLDIKTAAGSRLLALRRAAGGVSRPSDHRPGLAGEAMLMQLVREVGVPAPKIYYVFSKEDDCGDGFVMEWLEGEALGRRILREEKYEKVRQNLAYECGRILARIHSIDVVESGLDKCLQSMSPSDYVQQTWSRYKAFSIPQPMIDYTGRWLMKNLPKNYRMTLVHNEFRNGNLMVSPERIIGVIDWEIAHIGDPMRDLGWLCNNAWRYGESLPVGGFGTYHQLFQGYEDESGFTIEPGEVHFWEVFGSFWWSVTCLGMVEQFRNGPDPSIERAAIGRRSSEGQIDCVNLLMPNSVDKTNALADRSNLDSPRSDELLMKISEFLRDEVMSLTTGRKRFLAQVSANAIDIVKREILYLDQHRQIEHQSLESLVFGENESLEDLRWRLVHALREDVGVDEDALKAHLRQTVVNQIAIDNPKYSGLDQARNWK